MSYQKRCSVCQESKLAETSFGKDPTKHSRDGYKCRCKNCEAEMMRLQRIEKAQAEGRELKRYPTDYTFDENGNCVSRRCSLCREIKSADKFTKDPKRISGITHRCRECKAALGRRPESLNSESHRNSQRNHSLLKKNSIRHHTEEQWQRLKELTGNRCMYPECTSTDRLTRDHIIPLKEGGTDEIDNIQLLCLSHNSAKQHRRIIDYRPRHVRSWAFAEMSFVYQC